MSQPPLRLDESFFSEVHVEAVPDPPVEANYRLDKSVELFQNKESPERWHVSLTLRTAEKDHGSPYRVTLQCHGLFTVTEPRPTEAATAQMVGVTGASILFSAAREYLQIVTGRGPWGPLQLPTVTFVGARPTLEQPSAKPAEKDDARILKVVRVRGPIAARELANELSMSPARVRAALNRLEETGALLRVKKGRLVRYTIPRGQ